MGEQSSGASMVSVELNILISHIELNRLFYEYIIVSKRHP